MEEAPDGGSNTFGPRNDVSWYTRYPQLSVASATFPYPNRPGMSVGVGTLTTTTGSGDSATTSEIPISIKVPGVMVLDWYPNIGDSHLPTDPASMLGKEMYARVRKAYSGTLHADAPDYVMYVLCLDSIFAYIAWLKRLYRALSAYNPDNYVIPDTLLGAMGLTEADIVSLRANKMQLWQLINELVLQSRKFTCPGSLDIINRHYWMSDNIYMDDPSLNSQVYMFNLRGVYEYYEAGTIGPNGQLDSTIKASGCVITELPWVRTEKDTTVLTPEVLYNFGRNLIDKLVAWDDSYTISGYLSRAYEGTPGFIVAEIAQNEPLVPAFEPEVLIQIENSRTLIGVGSDKGQPMMYVRQQPSTNAVISDSQYWVAAKGVEGGSNTVASKAGNYLNLLPTMSMRSQNPTVAENIIASRMKAQTLSIELQEKLWVDGIYGSSYGTTATQNTFVVTWSSGTEVPMAWYLYFGDIPEDNTTLLSARYGNYIPMVTAPVTGTKTYPLFALGQFDWHPQVLYITDTSNNGREYSAMVIGDIHNFTTIGIDDLKNMHKVCLFSEFNSFSMM